MVTRAEPADAAPRRERHWYAARLEHVGRRSGRAYAMPVVARRVPGGLRHSPRLRARGRLAPQPDGRGSRRAHGPRHRYVITAPRTVPAAEVAGAPTPSTSW